jgi:hypothetical protein
MASPTVGVRRGIHVMPGPGQGGKWGQARMKILLKNPRFFVVGCALETHSSRGHVH